MIQLRFNQQFDVMPIAPLLLGISPLSHPLVFDKQLEVIEISQLPHIVR